MNEKVLKYLFDIKQSLDEIDSFFEAREKRFSEYQNNLLLKRAIERNLEIIGEARKVQRTKDGGRLRWGFSIEARVPQ